MKIKEAIEKGIRRVCKKNWAFPDCYILLPKKTERGLTPWAFLYSRTEQGIMGVKTPQELLCPTLDGFMDEECDEYVGKIDDEDKAE